MNLQDKVALVTGAGRGIGQGCALELARQGATIMVNDRSEAGCLATLQAVRALGVEAAQAPADIASRQAVEAVLDQTVERFGKIDILISNPAYSVQENFVDISMDALQKTFELTLWLHFHSGQFAARQMLTQKSGGSIVFISSVHSVRIFPGRAAYGMAKAALNRMTQAMAAELADDGIRVNAILPGWIDTPGEHEQFSEQELEAGARRIPMRRLGQPEDIGRAAAFLSSQAAAYITGACLPVDGGLLLLNGLSEA